MAIQKALIVIKKWIAFWIWRNLGGEKVSFYGSSKLRRFKTYAEPKGFIRSKIWNAAVDYLKSTGDLTHTPTLREKF